MPTEEPMKFRNPWVDPRVGQVRAAAARDYLLRCGWKPLPVDESHFVAFEGPSDGGENPVVRVPLLEQGRDYSQRVVELISDLALAEDRYAVEVLNDILRQSAAPAVPANG